MPLLILAFAQDLEVFLFGKQLCFCFQFYCSGLKLIYLSSVIPNNSIDGLATVSLSFRHFIAAFVSSSSLMEMTSKYFLQACRPVFVLRVTYICFFQKKKQLFDRDIKKELLLVQIPVVPPRIISNHSLYPLLSLGKVAFCQS